jgi:hypothetical protein
MLALNPNYMRRPASEVCADERQLHLVRIAHERVWPGVADAANSFLHAPLITDTNSGSAHKRWVNFRSWHQQHVNPDRAEVR